MQGREAARLGGAAGLERIPISRAESGRGNRCVPGDEAFVPGESEGRGELHCLGSERVPGPRLREEGALSGSQLLQRGVGGFVG